MQREERVTVSREELKGFDIIPVTVWKEMEQRVERVFKIV